MKTFWENATFIYTFWMNLNKAEGHYMEDVPETVFPQKKLAT